MKSLALHYAQLKIVEYFSISVEKWQHNRKFINPCFNHKVLLSFLPIFHKAKNHTLAKMDLMVGRGQQKIALLLQRTILGITVGKCTHTHTYT